MTRQPTGQGRRRGTRWTLAVVYALYAVIAVTATAVPALRFPLIALGLLGFGLIALGFGVRAATRRSLPAANRRAWWLLSGGLLLLNLVPLGMAASRVAAAQDRTQGLSGAPTYGDLLRLLAVLPLLGGLLSFPRANTTRRDGYKLLLDIVTVIGGSFMLIWYFILGPAVMGDLPVWTKLVSAAYPIGDLTLIFGATVVVLRGALTAGRRTMVALLMGLSLLVTADTYLGWAKLHPGHEKFALGQLGVMMSGIFMLAVSAIEQCLAAADTRQRAPRRPTGAATRLPYAALAVGSALLIVVSLRSGLYPWFGLIVGGVVMTASVAVRQFIAMRENHNMIISDSLTGLANRMRLHDGLNRAVERANRTGERTAVLLIDMDGFKQINDTLGHDAGDQMLVGYAAILRANVLGGDIVARLGGDEFAIVLHNVGSSDNAGAVAARILTGMQEPIAVNGEPVFPAASIGIAVTEPGHEVTPAELLHRADMAMYQAKARRGSTYRFDTDDTPVATLVTSE